MFELLIRTETLFVGLKPAWLLGIGVPALVIGLVFWLGGVRYSTPITGLLGAVVGAFAGLLVGQWLTLHLLLSMIIGAAVLATVSVLLRNVLILVLAVLVIALAAGGGYLAVLLDRTAPAGPAQQQADGGEVPSVPYQPFSGMDPPTRLDYLDRLARQEKDFSQRVRAIGTDTFEAAEPHLWKLILAALAGAVVSIFLVWFVRKALVALAYSVVGTALLFVGAQTALLAANFKAVSALPPNPWLLPATGGGMVAFGWLVQLISTRKPREKAQTAHKDTEEPRA